eukprot:5652905-Pyramimonas_sp.AAC.1
MAVAPRGGGRGASRGPRRSARAPPRAAGDCPGGGRHTRWRKTILHKPRCLRSSIPRGFRLRKIDSSLDERKLPAALAGVGQRLGDIACQLPHQSPEGLAVARHQSQKHGRPEQGVPIGVEALRLRDQ